MGIAAMASLVERDGRRVALKRKENGCSVFLSDSHYTDGN